MTYMRAAELLSDVTVLDDPEMSEAHRVAISALRKQEAATNRNGLNEPLTNAQKIRVMSDEELANIVKCPYGNPYFDEHLPCKGSCHDCLLIWLQQPAGEEGKHEAD